MWVGRTGSLRTAEERIDVSTGLGRILTRPTHRSALCAALPWRRHGRYAVRAGDTYGASDTTPIRLRAGESAHAVDTGDPLPEGCNAVIMIENVDSVSGSR